MSDSAVELARLSAQLESYMEASGQNAERTNESIERIQTSLDKSKKSAKSPSQLKNVEAAGDAAVKTTNAIIGSIDQFESGDPAKIAMGVLSIIGEVSQFAALAGPQGAIVAAIIGPICSITNAILGATLGKQEKEESLESVLERVITEALEVQTNNDLQAASKGLVDGMSIRYKTLRDLSLADGPLSDTALQLIADVSFMTDGVEFLGKLDYYIQKDMNTSDPDKAKRVAKLLNCYTNIAYLRVQELFLLSGLYYSQDANVLAKTANDLINQQINNDKAKFGHLTHQPNKNNHLVYARIHYLDERSKAMIEAYIGKFAGQLCTLYNTKQKQRLMCMHTKSSRAECLTSSKKNDISTRFRVFNANGKDKTGKNVKIFSIGAAGYVYAADYNPFDKDRRRVNAWTQGNSVKQGSWTVEKRKKGLTFRNNDQNEYLYSADYKQLKDGSCRVFTWRKGNRINQGYWQIRVINE